MSDDEQDFLGFLSALGEEYTTVMEGVIEDDLLDPHDGYEIFIPELGKSFGSSEFATLSDEQFDRIAKYAAKCMDSPGISPDHIREIVTRTIARWPV